MAVPSVEVSSIRLVPPRAGLGVRLFNEQNCNPKPRRKGETKQFAVSERERRSERSVGRK